LSIGSGVSGARKQVGSVEGSIGVVHRDVDYGGSGELGIDVGRGGARAESAASTATMKWGGRRAGEGRELHFPITPLLPQQFHLALPPHHLPGVLSGRRRGCEGTFECRHWW
jgi:hypothetical protein